MDFTCLEICGFSGDVDILATSSETVGQPSAEINVSLGEIFHRSLDDEVRGAEETADERVHETRLCVLVKYVTIQCTGLAEIVLALRLVTIYVACNVESRRSHSWTFSRSAETVGEIIRSSVLTV